MKLNLTSCSLVCLFLHNKKVLYKLTKKNRTKTFKPTSPCLIMFTLKQQVKLSSIFILFLFVIGYVQCVESSNQSTSTNSRSKLSRQYSSSSYSGYGAFLCVCVCVCLSVTYSSTYLPLITIFIFNHRHLYFILSPIFNRLYSFFLSLSIINSITKFVHESR